MVTPICFVPNCETGSVSCKENRCLFVPPADEARLIEWRRAIPRQDRQLTRDDRVCERHFEPRFVQRTWKIEYEGRVLAQGERQPYLKKDAVPTLFGCWVQDSNRAGTRLQIGRDEPDRAGLPSPCKIRRLGSAEKTEDERSQGRGVTVRCYGRSAMKAAATEGKGPVSTAHTCVNSVEADIPAVNCESTQGSEPLAANSHGNGQSDATKKLPVALDTAHNVPRNEIVSKGCANALDGNLHSSKEYPPSGGVQSAPLVEEGGISEDTTGGMQSQGSHASRGPTLVAKTTTSPQIVVLKAKAAEGSAGVEASPESSFDLLFRTAKQLSLPSDSWAVHCVEANSVRNVVFSQLVVKHEPAMMTVHSTKTVLVKSDMSVTVLLLNRPVKSVGDVSTEVSSIPELEHLLSTVDAARLCRGGPKHKLYPKARPECAYVDSMKTWRHSECPLVLAAPGTACKQCHRLFQTLRIHTRRLEARENSGKPPERVRIPRMSGENRVAVLRKARVDLQRSNSRLERRLQMLREELKAVKQEIKTLQEGALEPECEQAESAYEVEVERSQDVLEEQIEVGGEVLEQQFVEAKEIYEYMEAGQSFETVEVAHEFEGEVVEQAVHPSDQSGPTVFVVY